MQSNRRIQDQPRNLVRTDSTQSSSACAYQFHHFNDQFMTKGQEMPPQSLTMEYKDYTYPWDNIKKSILSECICAFLNTQGGNILIGIKESQNYKRTVKGYPQKQKEIQQLQKDITKLVQNISKMVVVNNLVKVKPVRVVDSTSNRRKPYYVVKITVEKGWLENYQRAYQYNGNYFYRTQNEVKCCNEQAEIDDIEKWRFYKKMQVEEKEFKKQQNIEKWILLQKNNKVVKPKIKSISTQTDQWQIPKKEQIFQEQKTEVMRTMRVETCENRVPLIKTKKKVSLMDSISKFCKKFTSICD